ncbi:MAG: hypothetical protein CMC13_12290 [Flavobacteriaceae bacterium]|nr:hypothetical protein [Flavobacteriaceae bacterium]|tara:strand:- start:165115 stop:165798 length:684 start_codon:yes stop_codon:yes gene_type:complete
MNTKVSTLLLFFLSSLSAVFGQFKEAKDVSMEELMLETQFTTENPDKMSMIWWIPFEFWEVSNAQDPTASFDEIAALKTMLEGYEVLAVVEGDIGYFGGITYDTKENVLNSTQIEYKGEMLLQVSEKKINSDLANFFSMMKPMVVNMFGPMGENMHFVFFENNNKSTVLPIDPKSSETVTFTLGTYVKEVTLPLNSMLLEKKCPIDKSLHSGKWSYCPFHGEKLIAQ